MGAYMAVLLLSVVAKAKIETGINSHQMHLMADNGEEGGCSPERADASPQNTMGYPVSTLIEPEVINLTDRGKHNSSITQKLNGINADTTGVGDETSDNDRREGESECRSQGADSNAQNVMGSQAPTLEENEVIDLTDSGDDDDDGEGEGKFWSQGVRSSSVLQEAPDSTGLEATITQLLSPLSSNIQPEDAVPHGDPLLMAGTGMSSSRQSIQRTSGHAIRDSVVYSRQPHKTN
ncbi:hypothetical protein BU23DRAFT_305716 [Bimuria novae-zelandiae CBS 107.79]|uniref:Uncharacterized protein n=1 Tax=Bimuria novae-zelandiae CBS 107.79 TaxID=1447943 RepID=A0A6A5UQT9_9PLEO|nr:hypothetical protein BU23DRAFT_305716 [Bimuria novae-zelandiae CBS 107.79]